MLDARLTATPRLTSLVYQVAIIRASEDFAFQAIEVLVQKLGVLFFR